VPAAAGAEAAQGQPGAGEHAADVDVELPLGGLRILVGEQSDGSDAGIVDQCVERTETLFGLVKERVEVGGVSDVEGQANGAVAQLGGNSATLCAIDVTDDDRKSGSQKGFCGGAPDAARSTCDRHGAHHASVSIKPALLPLM
jgi:hypothetical protein